MAEKVFKIGQLVHFRVGTQLDGNYHGPGGEPLTSTFLLLRMGSYAKSWGLWIYNREGRARLFELVIPMWRDARINLWRYSPKGCNIHG